MSRARRPVEVALPRDRVLLVGATRKGTRDAAEAQEHLDELARLADTAGAGRVIVALNESDLLVVEERARRLQVPQERGWEAVAVSAASGEGVGQLARTAGRTTGRAGRAAPPAAAERSSRLPVREGGRL